MEPCKFPDGIRIFPNGVDELDPCVMEDVVKYRNVTVVVSKCTRCGRLDWSWVKQDDTVEIIPEDEEFFDDGEQ